EQHAIFGSQFVHFGRERVLAPKAAPELRAKAFLEENHDIEFWTRRIAQKSAANGISFNFEFRIRLLEQAACAGVSFVQGKSFVESHVIQMMRQRGREEGKSPVVGHFVQRSITAYLCGIDAQRRDWQGSQAGQTWKSRRYAKRNNAERRHRAG